MELPADWPTDVDLLLLPERRPDGVGPSLAPQSGRPIHPVDQLDLRKFMRASGFVAEYASPEQRADVTRKSNEVWLGVVMFTLDALANGAGGMLVLFLPQRMGPLFSAGRVHAEFVSVDTETMRFRHFRADGLSGAEVVEVIKALEAGDDDG